MEIKIQEQHLSSVAGVLSGRESLLKQKEKWTQIGRQARMPVKTPAKPEPLRPGLGSDSSDEGRGLRRV